LRDTVQRPDVTPPGRRPVRSEQPRNISRLLYTWKSLLHFSRCIYVDNHNFPICNRKESFSTGCSSSAGEKSSTMLKSTLALGVLLAAATPVVLAAANDATPTTLASGNYWIRAVAAPNYHKYLQTSPANTAGPAILDSYKTAGQFNIVDGQLVNKVSNPPLYLCVEEPADKAAPPRTLKTWFSKCQSGGAASGVTVLTLSDTTKNPFGTFAFQGDARTLSFLLLTTCETALRLLGTPIANSRVGTRSVTWSVPSIKRQNLAAWLVCAKQQIFVNTGAYNYQTPSGCSDQTVSSGISIHNRGTGN